MILNSPKSVGCLVLFVTSLVAAQPSSLNQIPDDESEGKLEKKHFAQLLNNMVKVNEDRLKAMKTLSQLQGISVDSKPLKNPGHKALRSGFDDEGSRNDDEEERTLGAVFGNDDTSVLGDNNPLLRNANASINNQYYVVDLESLQHSEIPLRISKNEKKKPPNNIKPAESVVLKQKLQALRAEWRKTCDKAAAKNCTKACTAAYKRTCDSYRCKSKMKKAFKKNCKEACREKFSYDD